MDGKVVKNYQAPFKPSNEVIGKSNRILSISANNIVLERRNATSHLIDEAIFD